MQIYLPIAEMSVNVFLLLGLGGLVGILSGMFGVGGGFLMTPLLFFIGIPPAVAVATEANQIVASSFSGALAHLRRKTVDVKMGTVLLTGGLAGSALGSGCSAGWPSRPGRVAGQAQLCAVSGHHRRADADRKPARPARARKPAAPKAPPRRSHGWVQRLPLRTRFRTSRLYISVIPVLGVGAVVGLLAAIMGVGGGFIMVPAMIYLLGMPTKVVVGTSLFQIVFVTAFTTVMHATTNYSVDMALAVLLLLGGLWGRRSAPGWAHAWQPNNCASGSR
ncbi:MAG: sulfite exporter TauE/SafE family protein [Rhodobacteraceae bacterium]|nr:sulfite exporter TauE/SafE family protein [Paracoccaceae bacterium]